MTISDIVNGDDFANNIPTVIEVATGVSVSDVVPNEKVSYEIDAVV